MSIIPDISELSPIEYWAAEPALPLWGITNRHQQPCKDNFLCIYKNNTSTLYFINGRHKTEAQIGYAYFKQEDAVKRYENHINQISKKLNMLTKRELPFTTLVRMSCQCNKIYHLTEAVRFKKFESFDDKKVWEKFKNIGALRLRIRKEFELLYVQIERSIGEIALRHKTKKGDLFFYTYTELQELLEKNIKIDPQIITQRKKGYIYWIKDGKCHLYTGTTATRLLDQLDHRENNNRRNELKGISTIKRGIISGKVKIILHNKNLTQQIKEFKKGYILVTEMIRPESIVLSKKAKALITDEGGIISHAAIISREYGIPCIIGTKVATKVLKNGDPIELNTTTGVIKQL